MKKTPVTAPTGPNRYTAASELQDRGGVADFPTVVAAVAGRLAGKYARSRAINAVNAMIRRGCIERDGETLRLVQMPGRPLTAAELEQRKARRRQTNAASRVDRVPPPDDQDEDDVVLGVGRYALWSPRSLLDAGRADYLAWFVTRGNFKQQHRTAYRAACAVLGDYLRCEALRP